MEFVDEQLQTHNHVVLAYRILESAEDKFILMACVQLGYPQHDVARMLGVTQVMVSKRLKNVRKVLKLKQSEVIL